MHSPAEIVVLERFPFDRGEEPRFTSREDRRLIALAAATDEPHDVPPEGEENAGNWAAFFNSHGDPFVCGAGRGMFGKIVDVGTGPADYGSSRARHIAASCPAAVLTDLARLDALEALCRVLADLAGDEAVEGALNPPELALWRSIEEPDAPPS